MIRRSLLALALALCGCPTLAPDPACDRLLDCVAEVDPLRVGEATRAFGSDSPCWDEPLAAERCTRACDDARAVLATHWPEASACHPDPEATVADRLGDDPWAWFARPDQPCADGDIFRGAFAGGVRPAGGATFDLVIEILDGLEWRCTLQDDAFTCPAVPLPEDGSARIEGQFHASYAEVQAVVEVDECGGSWSLQGWRDPLGDTEAR